MKLKNVKVGQRVQVKDGLPDKGYSLYSVGDTGVIVSENLHDDYGFCAGEPSESPVEVRFDNTGKTYWVNLKRLRKVK